LSDISEPKCEECKKEVSAERTMGERERERRKGFIVNRER